MVRSSLVALLALLSIPAFAQDAPGTKWYVSADVGSAKKTAAFTVNAAPTVSGAVPNSAGTGASNLNVTITGTNFESGATVSFGGGINVNSTTFVQLGVSGLWIQEQQTAFLTSAHG